MSPHRVLLRALVVLVLAPLAPSAVTAQAAETPEHVAERYVRALKAQQWDSMAYLMHPLALRQLRELLTPLFESPKLGAARAELMGDSSLSDVRALSDTAVFSLFMSHLMRSQAQVMEFMRTARVAFLGHVAEGPDTVHVVYRMTIEDTAFAVSKMDIISLQRLGDSWRALLTADLRPLAAMLRREASL